MINDKATPIAMLIFVAFIAFFVFWSIVSIKDTSTYEFGYKTFCVDGKKAYYLHDRDEIHYQFFLTDEECDANSSKKVEEKK